MISQEQLSKPLACLTVAEFMDLMEQLGNKKEPQKPQVETMKPEYLRGQKELANFLHTSVSTIARLRAEGVFDACTIQHGKIVLFDRGKAIECMNARPPRKYEKWKRA